MVFAKMLIHTSDKKLSGKKGMHLARTESLLLTPQSSQSDGEERHGNKAVPGRAAWRALLRVLRMSGEELFAGVTEERSTQKKDLFSVQQ